MLISFGAITAPATETVKHIANSMNLRDMGIFLSCIMFCMAVVFWILNYVMQEKLKPVLAVDGKLDAIQNQQATIMTKIKSSEELERMIKIEVMEHELRCPIHKAKKGGKE